MYSFMMTNFDSDAICQDGLVLSRFMPFNERTVETISLPYIWFANIESFNDPFESQFSYHFEEDLESIIGIEMSSGLSGYDFESVGPILRQEHDKNPREFFEKYYELYKSRYVGFARPERLAYACFLGETNKKKPSASQISFMWGHYGNGLKGLRIIYDSKLLLDSLNATKAIRAGFIKYSKEPPRVDLLHMVSIATSVGSPRVRESTFFEAPHTKDDVWSYESELRVASQSVGAVNYDPMSIKIVDLGERMPEPQKRVIYLLMRQINEEAEIRVAKVKPHTFEVMYEPYVLS